MKRSRIITLALIGVTTLMFGIFSSNASSRREVTPSVRKSKQLSKVDERIVRAQRWIDQMPDKSEGYNQLASAYMQKARETADFAFNAKAEEILSRSLSIEPDNYDALKLLAKLQLTYHRFNQALETAHRAQTVRTDDHDVWGQITDAYVELGDYPAAVKAAQKMVDLRPDSSAYARVSYLRTLHGDTIGAIQAMNVAVKTANPNDSEAIAWCHVQLGNELMNAGQLAAAEQQFDRALATFPDHHLALQAKARARFAAGDIQGAVKIYEQQQSIQPSADAAQALGDLYTQLGQVEAAANEYRQFELLERENAELERSWRHMVNHWLDHDEKLSESLALARTEYEARKDIFTCDSLAWALFKNGQVKDSKPLIDQALRTGTKDARINYHAGIIYRSLNERDKARKYLQLGAALSSSFDPVQARPQRECSLIKSLN
jgi:tetratricopeptide (TPR) repeat protein